MEAWKQTKLSAIRRFGANIIQLPWTEFRQVMITHRYAPLEGSAFIHAFSDRRMIAGNGTIGLEILDDLPNVDSVIIPFGGGGLATGIATAIKGRKPNTKAYACETETAAPLAASFAAGSAQAVKRIPSFVDGIGAQNVLSEMRELVRPLLEGSIVVSLREIASAIGLLFERNRVIAEGAGQRQLRQRFRVRRERGVWSAWFQAETSTCPSWLRFYKARSSRDN